MHPQPDHPPKTAVPVRPPLPWWGVAAFLCLPVAGFARTPATSDAAIQEALAPLATLSREAVETGMTPGVVIAAGRDGRILYTHIEGFDSLETADRSAPEQWIFDLASVTKPVATALAVMVLVQDGRLALDVPVSRYLKEFRAADKAGITVEHLLRHTSGLPAVVSVEGTSRRTAALIERIAALSLRFPSGTRHLYSDTGYILLGLLVERVSGMPLDQFARSRIFEPLRMHDTRFVPDDAPLLPPAVQDRCVPTDPAGFRDPELRCRVHDPRARRMGGVAGHAGVFSTAADLARLAGALTAAGGTTPLRPEVRDRMFRAGAGSARPWGLGWGLPDPGETRPGHGWPPGGVWHLGFTGILLWLDPGTGAFLVVLGDRVAVRPIGDLMKLRRQAAWVVHRAFASDATPRGAATPSEAATPGDSRTPDDATGGVRTGLDRLAAGEWPPELAGAKVALITNHTGRDAQGRSAMELLHESGVVELVSILTPEHGLDGSQDRHVPDDDKRWRDIPVHSLFGPRRSPDAVVLHGAEAIVFDVQDAGARFYTYVSTMVNALRFAAENGLRFVVLDRPNPIGGVAVEGPLADKNALDFVGALRIPIRHGMTVGELARFAVDQLKLGVRLVVVPMDGWQRTMLFDDTGLPWIAPSPNLRTPHQALLYPGIGLLETTNLSVGRGTDTPFEVVGAPWIDEHLMVRALRAKRLPGITFEPTTFVPRSSKFRNESCRGVRMRVTSAATFKPVQTGLAIAEVLLSLHGTQWQTGRLGRLLKNAQVLSALRRGAKLGEMARLMAADERAFAALREPYLIYMPPERASRTPR